MARGRADQRRHWRALKRGVGFRLAAFRVPPLHTHRTGIAPTHSFA
ncbi:hypothetical protein MYA_0716 [Burkholderia sp. KJ006]|nr:hypothetical protein MYA_0716 [Burkholderia sp. KJ006]